MQEFQSKPGIKLTGKTKLRIRSVAPSTQWAVCTADSLKTKTKYNGDIKITFRPGDGEDLTWTLPSESEKFV